MRAILVQKIGLKNENHVVSILWLSFCSKTFLLFCGLKLFIPGTITDTYWPPTRMTCWLLEFHIHIIVVVIHSSLPRTVSIYNTTYYYRQIFHHILLIIYPRNRVLLILKIVFLFVYLIFNCKKGRQSIVKNFKLQIRAPLLSFLLLNL